MGDQGEEIEYGENAGDIAGDNMARVHQGLEAFPGELEITPVKQSVEIEQGLACHRGTLARGSGASGGGEEDDGKCGGEIIEPKSEPGRNKADSTDSKTLREQHRTESTAMLQANQGTSPAFGMYAGLNEKDNEGKTEKPPELPVVSCDGKVYWDVSDKSLSKNRTPPWAGKCMDDEKVKKQLRRYYCELTLEGDTLTFTLVNPRWSWQTLTYAFRLQSKERPIVTRIEPKRLTEHSRFAEDGCGDGRSYIERLLEVKAVSLGNNQELTLKFSPVEHHFRPNWFIKSARVNTTITTEKGVRAPGRWERQLFTAIYLLNGRDSDILIPLWDLTCNDPFHPTPIGKGSVGEGVFKAEHKGTKVAVKKMLHGPVDGIDVDISDIFYEVAVLNQMVGCRYIADVLGVTWDWTEKGTEKHLDAIGDSIKFRGPSYYYVVQELCYGGTLQDWVYDGPVNNRIRKSRPPKRRNPLEFGSIVLAHITNELFQALQYLNSYGFIHSDVKPDNCGMTKTPEDVFDLVPGKLDFKLRKSWDSQPLLKLIDFGCTQVVHDSFDMDVEQYASLSRGRGAPAYKDRMILRPLTFVKQSDKTMDCRAAAATLIEIMTQSKGVVESIAVEALTWAARDKTTEAAFLEFESVVLNAMRNAADCEMKTIEAHNQMAWLDKKSLEDKRQLSFNELRDYADCTILKLSQSAEIWNAILSSNSDEDAQLLRSMLSRAEQNRAALEAHFVEITHCLRGTHFMRILAHCVVPSELRYSAEHVVRSLCSYRHSLWQQRPQSPARLDDAPESPQPEPLYATPDMPSMPFMLRIKVVLHGLPNSGKTTLTRRLQGFRWEDKKRTTTIGIDRQHSEEVQIFFERKPYTAQLDIWDIAGERKINHVYPKQIVAGDACHIIMYDVDPTSTSLDSLKGRLNDCYENIRAHSEYPRHDWNRPILVIENKYDTFHNAEPEPSTRKVVNDFIKDCSHNFAHPIQHIREFSCKDGSREEMRKLIESIALQCIESPLRNNIPMFLYDGVPMRKTFVDVHEGVKNRANPSQSASTKRWWPWW